MIPITTSKTRPLVGLLLLVCTVLISPPLQARALEEQVVRAAVETWVRSITADARPHAVVERMEPHAVNGETVAFIAHLSGGGFCLCGAFDVVLPVYFYSPHGTYDSQNRDVQYILGEIGIRGNALREGLAKGDPNVLKHQTALAKRASFWGDLMSGRVPSRVEEEPHAEPEMVELNLSTRWHQRMPYNKYCPLGDGGRCVVGCVATAAVQIMRYWRWPPSGTGSYSYWWDGDQSCGGDVGGGTLSATFSDPYDWLNMPDHCVTGCSPAQEDALAELCYEVGVSIGMNYGKCGSGAYTGAVEYALEDFFRYDPDASFEMRDVEKMTEEIRWLRPMEFRGHDYQDDYRGHAWVIYGYNRGTDPDRQFKMNLGWGGSGDGWYSCDHIDVNNDDESDFWEGQKHLVRIAPRDVVRFVGGDGPGDGSPDAPYADVEEALALAPDSTTLIFKAGSVNTFFGSSLVIDRPLVLKGVAAIIQRE